jgi:hypothetical protein
MSLWRSYLRAEDGTATIEFVFVIPIVMTIFMASFESSFYMIRHVLLERSVDQVVRDLRLGVINNLTHKKLKTAICERSVYVTSVGTCVDSMKIWLQSVDTAAFAMLAPPKNCVDRSEPINPLFEPPANEFEVGSDNEIMLMRICLKEEPMFPTTIIGAGLIKDETDGSYGLVTTSVFVNEPG